MSYTPFEATGSLVIGAVEFVSPDEIKVSLDIEAPDSMALNSGTPRPFPRVNGYVLIPVEEGYLVGQVEWITVERSQFPKRRGMQDFGLVDLPFPLRKTSLNPIGTLRKNSNNPESFEFRRGTESLPSIGTTVILPTDLQLRSIVQSGDSRRVDIGTSPLAANAVVSVDPNRLFGRHLAVLGNTGSGKSCSVAGLIRWSIEQARRDDGQQPDARFIILDPNGEYSRAFEETADTVKARVFCLNPEEDDPSSALKVPLWFWNSSEWMTFAQASARTQRPALMQALRFAREGNAIPRTASGVITRRFLRTILSTIRIEMDQGTPWGSFPKPKGFNEKLEKWKSGLEGQLQGLTETEAPAVQTLVDEIERLCAARRVQYANFDFTHQDVQSLLDLAQTAHQVCGGVTQDTAPLDVDVPKPFVGDSLIECLEAAGEILNVSGHIETLLVRLRAFLADARIRPVVSDTDELTLENWLRLYVGGTSGDDKRPITIIDLSLVPSDVLHIITAVIARITFEALQRHVKLNRKALPTVLVMEEAHTFVKRYRDDAEEPTSAAICCQVFERIAREGRKFGLGLVVSSQRPSELSPTVLSQCNSFLLHRITNDRDQEQVHKLVPDNLKGLLRELPSLPSRSAILLGWASELPVLVRMNALPQHQQPQSDDPDFWSAWTGRNANGEALDLPDTWQQIADDWQGQGGSTAGGEE